MDMGKEYKSFAEYIRYRLRRSMVMPSKKFIELMKELGVKLLFPLCVFLIVSANVGPIHFEIGVSVAMISAIVSMVLAFWWWDWKHGD